jgi:hypothetical protein
VTLIGAEPMLASTAAAMTVRRRTFQPAAEFIEYLCECLLVPQGGNRAAEMSAFGGKSGHQRAPRRCLLLTHNGSRAVEFAVVHKAAI